MRIIRFLIFVLFLAGGLHAVAQSEQKAKNPRILLLLDGSSSMLHEWQNDKIRFEAAAQIIDKLMDSVYAVNKNVEFALRVYGHQSPTSKNNCFDTKLEVMFSKDNYTQMMLRLAALTPLGISPIAYSLQQAAEYDMKNLKENKYSLILITDGGESCEGDICKVVEELIQSKIDFKPYILSLVDYAPLKTQYACMGDYLLVTKPEDIEPVVGKIVESYRRTFIQPTVVSKAIETSRKAPSVLQMKPPEVKVKTPEPEPEPKVTEVIKQPEPEVVKEPEPEPQKQSNIVVANNIPEERKKEESFTVNASRQKSLPQVYSSRAVNATSVPQAVIPEPEPEPVRPKEPTYKPMAVAKTTTTTPTVRTKPQPKAMEYSVSREEASETELTIFFTNGKGKYYETAPEIVLRDTKTSEPVYKFNRNVDVYGKPRPEKGLPAGTYNLTITGKDGFMASNIEVRPGENNKYELIVTSGSLGFTYITNPDRPVKEYSARVGQAFRRSGVNRQLCSELVMYEPGNYHIDINTNPITTRNVDLDFGVTVYVGIEEPGGIEVYNPNGYQKVQFYYQHGDQYEIFKPRNVTGSNAKQEFLIQPGRYKVAYIKDPLVPNPKPKIKEFIIKGNIITEVTLD